MIASRLIYAVTYIVLVGCFTPQIAASQIYGEPYSRAQNVADRAGNKSMMISNGLEYIASESYTSMHIIYNVFLQPEIAQDAAMPDLDPERILAEERMSSEAERLCNNHLRANDCHVFFWANMSVMPPGDKNFYLYGIRFSDGVFRAKKGGKKEFLWWKNAAGRRTSAFNEVRLSDESNNEDNLPYQREVRASNRFLDGARMVAEDLEFISVESVVRMHAVFHIYVHPALHTSLKMDRLAEKRLIAEKNILKEARKLCSRYKKADDCGVLLWSRLDQIPLEKDNTDIDALLKLADGYYRFKKGEQPVFRWKDKRR